MSLRNKLREYIETDKIAVGLLRRLVGTLVPALAAGLVLAAEPVPPAATVSADKAHTSVKVGHYCPDEASLFLVLEELTVALHPSSRAHESLLVLDDAPTAGTLLV
jgi:hypothetical protein